MQNYSVFVGIDASQNKHDFSVMNSSLSILNNKKKVTFDNTLQGYQKFIDTVTTIEPDLSKVLFGLEVTGVYGDGLFDRLKLNGLNVIMIRPESVKKYRDYIGLPKTDKLDAKCITEILARGEAKAVSEKKKEYDELKTLTHRRSSLSKTLTQEKNRLNAKVVKFFPELLHVFKSGHNTLRAIFSSYSTPYSIINADKDELLLLIQSASKKHYGLDKMNALISASKNSIVTHTILSEEDTFTIQSLLESVIYLEGKLRELDKRIESKLESFPLYKIILSFTGCGKLSAATIIAELGDITRFNKASQIVKFAGIFGDNSESGTSVNRRGRMAKKGSRDLRHALYMIAEFARRNNPILKDVFNRKKNGDRKRHILAVNALTNKICAILFSIMRNESVFVIQHRDLMRIPEVTRAEFFQNIETEFSSSTRKKIYKFEDEFGEIHDFVYRSARVAETV
ncbi:transposase IS116/IS110/IS902 family protein [Breznakia blatticola]|uniref:Transposase IS116/IS110/IS902 family protein n=1 Tax=Breznakia blatticola TaxID=1754012 RepID=A0A4R7ZEG9_9FIRM|nr:IS110 family transposase [Breznakia blatticola]TDW07420.1 transposase IS116/IS110/IS902 family protein [Breznakia blatticola]